MKNKNEFHGKFADEFRLFLQEKHSLGIKYTDEERMLYKIDEMTLDYDCQYGFPKALVEEFIRFRPHWAKATQESHINLIRQIALFLIKMELPSYCPDFCWKGNSTRDFHPYIYTHEEMEQLFAVADNPGNRIPERSRDFHSVIYRLLYSSGLRVSEAIKLTMSSQDIPYDAALPVLCAYMGHSSLSATTKYLHLTQELYPEISQRLERSTGGIIPDMEGIGNENE